MKLVVNPPPVTFRDSVYSVYIEGTTVKARNNVTGVIDYTADNNANAITAINSAINNIKNIPNIDTNWGAKIDVKAGVYKCITNLLDSADTGDSAREGIILEGEGMGTVFNFVPSSALTNAITFKSSNSGMSRILVKVNSNVTNAVKITGLSIAEDGKGTRGKIESCRFEGPNAGGSFLPVANQIGILDDGTVSEKAYWWRIQDNDFISFDIGIKATGANATSAFISNNVFHQCNTGTLIDQGQEFFITENYVQNGPSVGNYGVRLTNGAAANFVSNIITEMNLSGVTCAGVQIESGCIYNTVKSIINAHANVSGKFTVINNSANNTNAIGPYTELANGYTSFGPGSPIDLRGSYIRGASGGYQLSDNSSAGLSTIRLDTDNVANAMFMQFVPGANFTSGGSDGNFRSIFRFYNNNSADPEFLEFGAYGTQGFLINAVQAGTGSLRPLVFGMNYTNCFVVNTNATVTVPTSGAIQNLVISGGIAFNGTNTSGGAVAGSGATLPAKPQGYINTTISGVVRYIPFY